jgi:hypothetical protein
MPRSPFTLHRLLDLTLVGSLVVLVPRPFLPWVLARRPCRWVGDEEEGIWQQNAKTRQLGSY